MPEPTETTTEKLTLKSLDARVRLLEHALNPTVAAICAQRPPPADLDPDACGKAEPADAAD